MEKRISRRKHGLIQAVLTLLLLFSWWLALGWVSEDVTLSLVPYDDVWPEFRPSPETWQRQLNDLFERPPVRYMPACLLGGASILLFLVHRYTFRSPAARVRLILGFTASNLLLVLATFAAAFVLIDLLPELPRSVYGRYGYTYRAILVDTLLVGLWWALQAWGIPRWASARAPHDRALSPGAVS